MDKVIEFKKLIEKLHESIEAEKMLKEVAFFLMNELCINASGIRLRVAECESYYDDGKNHKDMFLYGDEKQKKKMQWFFHYSGIDLTIGNDDEIKGGILIRSIQVLNVSNEKEFISGPLKSANYTLNNTFDSPLCLTETPFLKLEAWDYDDKNEAIILSKRIGLDTGKITSDLINLEKSHFSKEYRYALNQYVQTENKKYRNDTEKNEKRMDSIIKTNLNASR